MQEQMFFDGLQPLAEIMAGIGGRHELDVAMRLAAEDVQHLPSMPPEAGSEAIVASDFNLM